MLVTFAHRDWTRFHTSPECLGSQDLLGEHVNLLPPTNTLHGHIDEFGRSLVSYRHLLQLVPLLGPLIFTPLPSGRALLQQLSQLQCSQHAALALVSLTFKEISTSSVET